MPLFHFMNAIKQSILILLMILKGRKEVKIQSSNLPLCSVALFHVTQVPSELFTAFVESVVELGFTLMFTSPTSRLLCSTQDWESLTFLITCSTQQQPTENVDSSISSSYKCKTKAFQIRIYLVDIFINFKNAKQSLFLFLIYVVKNRAKRSSENVNLGLSSYPIKIPSTF
jgi:hypothetical protein